MAGQTYKEQEYLIAGEKPSSKVELGCCGECSRFIVKWSNTILALCGLALIGLACYQLWKPDSVTDWTGNDLSYGLIGLGSVVVVLSCMGWCSSRKQSICGLGLYSLFLVLIIVGEIVAAAYTISHETEIESYMQDLWTHLPDSDKKSIADDLGCHYDPDDPDNPETFTCCYNEVESEVKDYWKVVSIVSLGVVGYQIFLLVLSCCLMKEIRLGREQKRLQKDPYHNVRSSYAGVYA